MSKNKTIFLNTIFLYFRMVLIIGISLYTVRVLYNTLGVEDFGLFNLISGFVVLFTFLNSAMRSGTQRYLNVALASNKKNKVNNVFCASINIYFLIVGIVLLFTETIGLWFLNNKLNIVQERLFVANIVYQCAILTMIVNIISIPYQAIILAKEKMKFYAYLGVFEAFSKLIIVFLLMTNANIDVLVLYSILLVIISIAMTSIYYFYAHEIFYSETRYKFKKNNELIKEMISFSGWNLYGQIALLSSNQGVTILFNIFFGVVINASIAVANQVSAIIYGFSSNLQTAFNAQIVQTYAQNDTDKHIKLVFTASKYSLFLMTIIAMPLILYTEFILKLWLGDELPNNLVFLTKIILLISLLDSISGPFWMSIHAIGNIKKYQLIISGIMLMNLPISYILLSYGLGAKYVFCVGLFIAITILVFRFYYLIKYFDIKFNKIKEFIISVLPLYFILCALASFSYYLNVSNIWVFVIHVFFFEIVLILIIFFVGLSKDEINFIRSLFVSKFLNKRK